MPQPSATCPTCGQVPLENITVYSRALRKQTFAISPILPTCNSCGMEVEVTGHTQGARILLLNGTCGSGKSATAEELVKNHGFMAIDSDCTRQVIKHKLGIEHVAFDSIEMHEEIGREIDILSTYTRDIVLSHVVMPADIAKYKGLFESKGMKYRIILLRPSYETALSRTKTRTCHTSITPEEWVRYFYDSLVFDDMEVLDNSHMTVAEAARVIVQSPLRQKAQNPGQGDG